MQITVISDTHGHHDRIKSLNKPAINSFDGLGKMIIHAGDITEDGTEAEVRDFLRWFAKLPYQYKIFIGGNHDLFLAENSIVKIGPMIPQGVYYLNNSGLIVDGIRIWGSPVTPYFMDMGFNKKRGKEIRKVWNGVPSQTDILITHGAPLGILDGGIGCEDLLNRVVELKPKYHLFGHTHCHTGIKKVGETTFINAAIVDSPDIMEIPNYQIIAEPIVFDCILKEEVVSKRIEIDMDTNFGRKFAENMLNLFKDEIEWEENQSFNDSTFSFKEFHQIPSSINRKLISAIDLDVECVIISSEIDMVGGSFLHNIYENLFWDNKSLYTGPEPMLKLFNAGNFKSFDLTMYKFVFLEDLHELYKCKKEEEEAITIVEEEVFDFVKVERGKIFVSINPLEITDRLKAFLGRFKTGEIKFNLDN